MARGWKDILNSVYFTQNRPQWLIAPLPVPPSQPAAPPFSAFANVGGLLPNVAQMANDTPRFDGSMYQPYFTDAQYNAAQDYTNRVVLSPIGGPYG